MIGPFGDRTSALLAARETFTAANSSTHAAMSRFRRFLRREDGPTTVEYAVMLALIIAVCIGAITLVGGGTQNFWENNKSQLETYFSGS